MRLGGARHGAGVCACSTNTGASVDSDRTLPRETGPLMPRTPEPPDDRSVARLSLDPLAVVFVWMFYPGGEGD